MLIGIYTNEWPLRHHKLGSHVRYYLILTTRQEVSAVVVAIL